MIVESTHPLPPETKGWCPSLLRPMPSGDGLIARIKPTAATLHADDLLPVVEAAKHYGNGHLEITRRGNLQARGFDDPGHAAFAEIVVGLGLAAPDPEAEARRTVLAAPLSAHDDPSCAFDAHALAGALENAITQANDLAVLPGKFGIAVDGGGVLGISRQGHAPSADMTIAPIGGQPALFLAGNSDAACDLTVEQVLPAVLAVMRAFAKATDKDIRRMRDWVTAKGASSIFARVGLSSISPSMSDKPIDPPVGWVELPGQAGALVLAAPFGRLMADQLSALCRLTQELGDGTLRLTPWRSLVVPGVAPDEAAQALDDCAALGLITQPQDPRLHMAVCTGAPGCQHGHANVLKDAALFAAHWRGQGVLHVSGCAKGCAHSGPAELTLLATAAGYDWIEAGDLMNAAASELSADAVAARLSGSPA